MIRGLLCLILTLFFIQACQTSEEEITQVLTQREEAFRRKDLSLYLACISKEYRDKEEDFDRLGNRIGGYFKNFERIEYTSWGRSIRIQGEDAEVLQQFHLEVERGGEKKRYSGQEALFLRREGKKWKIIKGL